MKHNLPTFLERKKSEEVGLEKESLKYFDAVRTVLGKYGLTKICGYHFLSYYFEYERRMHWWIQKTLDLAENLSDNQMVEFHVDELKLSNMK